MATDPATVLFELGGLDLPSPSKELVQLATTTVAGPPVTYSLIRCPCGGMLRRTVKPRVTITCIGGCAHLRPVLERLATASERVVAAREELKDAQHCLEVVTQKINARLAGRDGG